MRVYGPRDRYDCGGTVAFNLLDERGVAVPYELVEERARRASAAAPAATRTPAAMSQRLIMIALLLSAISVPTQPCAMP